jgi:hypothetical protein
MIEVDVFWSFAMGAGFAAMAHREIERGAGERVLLYTVLFLSLLFAPSGLYLLWRFPGWESMYLFASKDELHAALPTLFALTNVLLGVLGFLVAAWLVRRGSLRGAHLASSVAYQAMFAVLGFGYRRFMYPEAEGVGWRAGRAYPLAAFFSSEVFATLLVMGLALLPALFYPQMKWFWASAHTKSDLARIERWLLEHVAAGTAVGCAAYCVFLVAASAETRAHMSDGWAGPFAPMVGFVVAQSAYVAIQLAAFSFPASARRDWAFERACRWLASRSHAH